MTVLAAWSNLPAHGAICLAAAPSWYVPLLATLLLITVGSYAAIEVWSEAVARAGSLELERVTAVLRRGRFATGADQCDCRCPATV